MSSAKAGCRRALLVQFKRIGDTLLLEPLVRSLREADWHVTLGVLPSCIQAARLVRPDSVLVWHGGLSGAATLLSIATSKFSACMDLGGTDRCLLASLASLSPKKIAALRFRKRGIRRQLYPDFVDASVFDRHTIDYFLDHLAPLGIPPTTPPELRFFPDDRLPEVLMEIGPFAAIHPGAARPEKFWPSGRWAEVARHLAIERGLRVVLTGAMGADEITARREIQAAVPEVIDLGGKCDLPATASVFAAAKLVLTVDSMPVHLASGTGTPTLALFGPTNPRNWGPRGPHCLSLHGGICHSNPSDFPPGNPRNSICENSVAHVLAALRLLLSPLPHAYVMPQTDAADRPGLSSPRKSSPAPAGEEP